MPLVFVHGVATRPSREYAAEVAQRDALFRSLTFKDPTYPIFNPDWGSFGVKFEDEMPWLPRADGNQAFGPEDEVLAPAVVGRQALDGRLSLGALATHDAEQAIDLVVMAALEQAIKEAGTLPTLNDVTAAAARSEAVRFAIAAGDYIEGLGVAWDAAGSGAPALETASNAEYADALEAVLADPSDQAFGVGSLIGDALDFLGGTVSDLALRGFRRKLTRGVSLFLGDVFVYLRGRDIPDQAGTRARIFEPIIQALVQGVQAQASANDQLIVVGHSLGGVLLYDILTDPQSRARIEAATGRPIDIHALFTVGSQPGFFADLGLYPGGRPVGGAKRPRPEGVDAWMNVYDFTDVFSFRCEPAFDGVDDLGYDTRIDLVQAHTAYFQRPSFYKRMRARLAGLQTT
jgi:hypothetical protein